eukprot:TRINITY_DN4193_c0_g1_i2.p2 TRINITY_DN4193_c0_g1~~TRINITY_DN4193_c0_g1_i2.p2  ORF type:complete len:260 (-),score=158.21 TRINITY_DN4193_c0_g1_i2:47-796(-)
MNEADLVKNFHQIASQSVTDQAKAFLRAFVLDFQGKFEEVLDIAEQFPKFSSTPSDSIVSLTEHEAHLFLEKRGETLTVRELRDYLRELRAEKLTKVSLIQYLLWKYKKDLTQLFTPPPTGAIPQDIIDSFDRALEAYIQTKKAQKEREEEIKRLKETASGKRSVASVQAKNQADQLAGQEFSAKFAELRALKDKKEAQKALENAEKIDPYVEEQRRLEEEKRRKDEEEKKAKDEARARLKARAAAFGK